MAAAAGQFRGTSAEVPVDFFLLLPFEGSFARQARRPAQDDTPKIFDFNFVKRVKIWIPLQLSHSMAKIKLWKLSDSPPSICYSGIRE